MRSYVQASLIGLVVFASTARANLQPHHKISERVHIELTSAGKKAAPIFVTLQAQADLSPAATMLNRDDKGRFVYDALRKVALESQGDLQAFLRDRNFKFQSFYISNMIAVFDATAELVAQLAARPDVAKINSNASFKSLPPIDFAQLGATSWLQSGPKGVGSNISSTGADRAWNDFNARGQGIVVASQDTGIQWDHPALRRQYRGGSEAPDHNYNWHDAIREKIGSGRNPCGYATQAPCDDNGHGTHTVGTMLGDDNAGNQIGMAPAAQWIGCRNMDAGIGRPTTYIECFEFFLAPYAYQADPMTEGDPTKAPHIINNSWGCPRSEGCMADEIRPVLQALDAAGIAVVAAAGNEGSSCQTITDAPAMHSDLTIAVGAHDARNGAIASFSSRGPSKFDGKISPDVTAPGVNVRSAVPGGGYSGSAWSGTSMASPHVAGLFALLWSAQPNLLGNIPATTAIITSTATRKTSSQSCGGVAGSSVPNNTFGHGMINAYEAVKAATEAAEL